MKDRIFIFDFVYRILNRIISIAGLELTIINFIIFLGVFFIYLRVFKNFQDSKLQKNNKKREVKSVVETTSMTCFFMVCSFILSRRIGCYNYHSTVVNIIATIVYVIGTSFNLLGRYYLGTNWGNNVIIYKDHTLVNNGVYKIVRHPLYASIIWMIYAVAVIYSNYLVIVLNTVIFIPFMYYRAKQEEKELEKEFIEYKDYRDKTGMFFPKLFRKK